MFSKYYVIILGRRLAKGVYHKIIYGGDFVEVFGFMGFTFGAMGFTFGLIAFTTAVTSTNKLKEMEKRIEDLEEKS